MLAKELRESPSVLLEFLKEVSMETKRMTALEERISKATENLIAIDVMEAEYAKLLERGAARNADSWVTRVQQQTPHCKFGETGVCCKICAMGPCRITPKSPKGICGCDVHGIVARNYLRFTAAGSATHSDHGREICHTLYSTAEDGNYKVKDPDKLIKIAKEWGIETEGKDIYDLAHEVAYEGLQEYGKPFGTQRLLARATKERQEVWARENIEPRAIDREVSTSQHMTHMGCSSLPDVLIRQALRAGMSDGWGGSMMGTEFSDIMFGTPKPIETAANLGVIDKDCVNIMVHGHDPSLSEMIVEYADNAELVAYAKSVGAKGINVVGVCCTSNEVTMRHGIPMAGNFLQQENAVLTGAIEAVVVDVQCIFPALGPLSKCFHTKFITTSDVARMPDSEFHRFNAKTAGENAKNIVTAAIENFKNRDQEAVYIPELKTKAKVGYSCEAIIKQLDTVTSSYIDQIGTYKPLIECIESGVLRGAVAMVGCNNPKVRADFAHIELMKKLLANDIILVLSGCSAQSAAKAGLMHKDAKEISGAGIKRVCELADIPPVLHMGSCVDISRMMLLVNDVADQWGIDVTQLPVVGCAPEWMSEKAVSIGNYVISTGIDTFLGIIPYVSGSDVVTNILTNEVEDWVGAKFFFETDIDKLGDAMINRIEEKRVALGI
jgi:carbon-monoxide dehydrogenase catalytic subunit